MKLWAFVINFINTFLCYNLMKDFYMKVKKLDEKAIIPSKRDEDVGYDIYGIFEEDFKILQVGDVFLCKTGLSFEIPKNWFLYVCERGSTGVKAISKRAGIIDSGYRGEVFIALNNTNNKKQVFYKNENEIDEFLQRNNLKKEEVIFYPQSKAVAQIIPLYSPHIEIQEVDSLSESKRGEGKIGDSGK